jgi:DNA-binding NarL/FixJ family response regulator
VGVVSPDRNSARGRPRNAPRQIALALIDNHQLLRQTVCAWLAVEGREIDVVASVGSVEELRGSAGWGADVVLLDLDLADGSNVEDNVIALYAAGSRVVVTIATSDASMVSRAVRAGAMSCVSKSASAEEMLTAVRRAGRPPKRHQCAVDVVDVEPAGRPRLSPQELKTLRWYAGGLPMKSVALRLGVSEGCVKSYVDRIREKYEKVGRDAPTKIDLYRRAVEDGYLRAPEVSTALDGEAVRTVPASS